MSVSGTAQSPEFAALAAHVQALQATIAVQAGQIAALQTATGTATVPSLAEDATGVLPFDIPSDLRFAGTEGATNTSLGTDALGNNDTGSENTAIGAYALEDNTTGDLHTAIGNRDERLSKTS